MIKKEKKRVGDKGIGLRMRNEDIFLRPKILTRKTADKIIATYDDENYYFEQTLHSTHITSEEFLPLYILALLNSTLIEYYYKSIVKQSGTIFPQVRISFLKSLPIKKCLKTEQEIIVRKVLQMLDLHKKLNETKSPHEKTVIQRQIDATDKNIDKLVYELYDLTEEEIKIVEGKV